MQGRTQDPGTAILQLRVRDVDALTTPEWATVAERNKDFGAIVEKLKKEKK